MNFAPEEPAGTQGPVDFPAALGWVDGDQALLAELIGIFLEDCPRRLQELEQAASEGNAIGVRQSAHSLKGMVACFATRSAQRLAAEMEDLGKAGNVSKASELLPALLLEFARVMHHLKAADWQEKN
jgi:HPt (histidine-containing phosphotransfer) domain-containing protein